MNVYDRFFSKVDYSYHPSGCFLWTGAKNAKGYGRFALNGRNRFAHNVIWEWWVGPIPLKIMICHTCDNPSCVRLDHLFAGTALDNLRDMQAKNRGNYIKGETHPKAKLSALDVELVRTSSTPTARLAKQFGVTYKAIDFIRKGVNWRQS